MTKRDNAMDSSAAGQSLPCRTGNEADVINLLLEEYRTLRQEIIARLTNRAQLLAFSAAATGLIASGRSLTLIVLVIGTAAMAGLCYWLSSNRGVRHIASHVADIEAMINQLAARAYDLPEEAVLRWEIKQASEAEGKPRWWRYL
jgi:hypothetical protein